MNDRGAAPVDALIVALPETAGSALCGMVDVLGATGTLWRQLVGEEPGERLIRPRIVGPSRESFRCGNAIPVCPELGLCDDPEGDIVVVPELWLSPDDDMKGRYPDLVDSVGYENEAFFRRLFKRSTGLTLAEYRRMFQPLTAGARRDVDRENRTAVQTRNIKPHSAQARRLPRHFVISGSCTTQNSFCFCVTSRLAPLFRLELRAALWRCQSYLNRNCGGRWRGYRADAGTPFFLPPLQLRSSFQARIAVLVLSTLVAWYFFLPPYHSFVISDAETFIQLLGFLLVGMFGVALIAALVELVQRLDAAARLQEGLFRELQHRTANNMQIVAAMLHLTRDQVADEAALEVLDRAAARISSMAQLHRRLYSQEAYERGLEPILRDVLRESFGDVPVDVRLDVEVEGLSLDQMMSILLLVNEAAMNAAKHVFRPRQGGRFEVSLAEPANGQVRLVIRDDGPGFAGTGEAESSRTSLGMTIMRAFAGQLGGSLQVLEGPGHRATG